MKTSFRILLFVPLLLLCGCRHSSEPRKLTVRGEATLYKPADQLELVLGVLTDGKDPQKTVQENNEKMTQVLAVLLGLGLNKNEIQTTHYRIQPMKVKHKEGEDGSQGIDYYEVTNTLQIKTQKLDLVETIIGKSVEAGVNQILDISFNLNNPLAYRNEAIKAATDQVLSEARALADATGTTLAGILNLDLEQNSPRPFPRYFANQMNLASSKNGAFEVGEVEVRATVIATFKIKG